MNERDQIRINHIIESLKAAKAENPDLDWSVVPDDPTGLLVYVCDRLSREDHDHDARHHDNSVHHLSDHEWNEMGFSVMDHLDDYWDDFKDQAEMDILAYYSEIDKLKG